MWFLIVCKQSLLNLALNVRPGQLASKGMVVDLFETAFLFLKNPLSLLSSNRDTQNPQITWPLPRTLNE